VKAAIKRAADAAGRTYAKELELRLTASVQGDYAASDLYRGWPEQDQVRFRSLGNVVGVLAARVALVSGWTTPGDLLTAMRGSLNEMLTALGASADPSKNDKFLATVVAQPMVAEMRHATRMRNPSGEDAALAEAATAWGLKP
jgi:hypothetical protein